MSQKLLTIDEVILAEDLAKRVRCNGLACLVES